MAAHTVNVPFLRREGEESVKAAHREADKTGMWFFSRATEEGGRTAREHHDFLLRRWRVKMRLPLLIVVASATPLAIPVWLYFPLGQFYAGMWIGATLGMVMWIWDDPPEHVARWKRGAEGERQTAKALRSLEREGWRAFHDRESGRGNLDHIVIGPPGVFLLETKTLSGVITFEPQGLTTRHEHSARNDFIYSRLDSSMRGAAAALKQRIEQATQLRPWVQAVVVIWGEFPDEIAEGDRVVYVAGERLAEWLTTHEQKLTPRNERLIELALDAELVAPPAAAIV